MKRITIIIAVFLLGLIWLIPCKVTADTNVLAPRVFNVLNYGAVGDDKTDNTAAFSACIKAVIEAGGGRMFLHCAALRICQAAGRPGLWRLY